jgi:DNA mismatch repair ATPase MutL
MSYLLKGGKSSSSSNSSRQQQATAVSNPAFAGSRLSQQESQQQQQQQQQSAAPSGEHSSSSGTRGNTTVLMVNRTNNSSNSIAISGSNDHNQERATSVRTTAAGPNNKSLEEVLNDLIRLKAMREASGKNLLIAREAKEVALVEMNAMQREVMAERIAKVKLVTLNARLESVLSRGQTALQDIEQLKDM